MVSTSHSGASAARIARPAPPSVVAASAAQLLELALMVIAGGLLLASMVLPYWQITLHAPQYPKGLVVQAYLFQLTGDVFEVDGLNHYIGMMKLEDAAFIERQIALVAIPLVALLTIASVWLRGVWRVLARLPIIIFPLIFVGDLFAWLYYAGHSLDPHAALSSSIKPFTPSILGAGGIGQFTTEAEFQAGFALAAFAALIVLIVSLIPGGRSDDAR